MAFITSLITLGLAWYSAASNAHGVALKAEAEKRNAVIQRLVGYYISSHDGISPEIMAGIALPPTDWLDQQLANLHQNWRMKDYNAKP
ncbi:hypothetical protein EAS56_14080 [Bradyrhizobium guangzhouense]|uniref:Type II secretion system protein n=1 Tax=Bradyrhizobium guangzhouense TaxID=1325095 RepID=A0ABY0E7G0_9BRAD|nr:hypothetical protein EAS56_14080 [Bradyrhizobium guangzhouense]